MVLTYDAYNETIEKEKQRELEMKNLKENMNQRRTDQSNHDNDTTESKVSKYKTRSISR